MIITKINFIEELQGGLATRFKIDAFKSFGNQPISYFLTCDWFSNTLSIQCGKGFESVDQLKSVINERLGANLVEDFNQTLMKTIACKKDSLASSHIYLNIADDNVFEVDDIMGNGTDYRIESGQFSKMLQHEFFDEIDDAIASAKHQWAKDNNMEHVVPARLYGTALADTNDSVIRFNLEFCASDTPLHGSIEKRTLIASVDTDHEIFDAIFSTPFENSIRDTEDHIEDQLNALVDSGNYLICFGDGEMMHSSNEVPDYVEDLLFDFM